MTESNNIFIPFAYCSIERASSFLTEALGQTITIEDIEHLIEMKVINLCIHVDRFFNSLSDPAKVYIFYQTTETFYKPIDEYLTNNKKQDSFSDTKMELTDDAPEALKEFMTIFDCCPFYPGGLSRIGNVDNKDYFSRLNEHYFLSSLNTIVTDDDDELKSKRYGLRFFENFISLNSLAPIAGLCEIDSFFTKEILKSTKSCHTNETSIIPIRLLHNPKCKILSKLNNVIIQREDLKITADSLRKFIDYKSNNKPIKPSIQNTTGLFDEFEKLTEQSQSINPISTPISQDTVLKALGVMAHLLAVEKPKLKHGGKPNASRITEEINNRLSELGCDYKISENIRKVINQGWELVKSEIPENKQ